MDTPFLSLQFEHSCAYACNNPTINEQVGACDETGMFAEQEGCCIGNLVACCYALGGRGINHALVAPTGTPVRSYARPLGDEGDACY